jgi:hypothetical protein
MLLQFEQKKCIERKKFKVNGENKRTEEERRNKEGRYGKKKERKRKVVCCILIQVAVNLTYFV